jgi:hypothetical protein
LRECGPTDPNFAFIFGRAFAAVCFNLTFAVLLGLSASDEEDDDADDKLNSDPDEEALASGFLEWIRCM